MHMLAELLICGNAYSLYDLPLIFSAQAIASNLSYPTGVVKHVAVDGVDGDVDNTLCAADLVIYGSFLEEQSFPEILMKAMWLGKPIAAPDLAIIRKYVCFLSSRSTPI